MTIDFALPSELRTYLPDSDVSVIAWSGNSGRLELQIDKEIGAERGRMVFEGVSYVSLAQQFVLSDMRCGGQELLPTDFFDGCHSAWRNLDPDERVYLLQGVDGPPRYVLATSLSYRIDEPGKTPQ